LALGLDAAPAIAVDDDGGGRLNPFTSTVTIAFSSAPRILKAKEKIFISFTNVVEQFASFKSFFELLSPFHVCN